MFSLTYVSSASRLLSTRELLHLVDRCHEKNREADITGLLLHKGGNFMQVLEGEDEAVNKILAVIRADDRHRGLITLLRDPLPERQFPGWPLGFVDCDPRAITGVTDIAARVKSFFAPAFRSNPSGHQKLLLSFAAS